MSAVPFQACRAHLFKETGGLRNKNHMDQNVRHSSDSPSLFEGNKVTEKKDANIQENDLDIEKGLAGQT